MRNVRLIFSKRDRMKFVSHLDMNRYFIRLFRVAQVPLWYTEGFHQHPYLSLALPLSLGYESDYEIADLKIVDDEYSNEQLLADLNANSVPGVVFIKAFEPLRKTKDIVSCEWQLTTSDADMAKRFSEFLKSDRIETTKRNKKGEYNPIEIGGYLSDVSFKSDSDGAVITMTLPAGNELNINPNLYFSAFFESRGETVDFAVLRTKVFSENKELFL